MTVAVSAILSRVRTQLVDSNPQPRWTDAELLNWLSDGERSIVAAIPWAYQVTGTLTLSSGSLQELPSGFNYLLDAIRNMNADGSEGPACFRIDRKILDTQNLNWNSSSNASTLVKNYCYDEGNPSVFYVYPYNNGSGQLLVNCSISPPDHVATTENIYVLDIFQTALVDYVLFRAHQKDSDFAAGQQLAAQYFQAFTTFLQARSGAIK
jgi:hypothetical protein